MDALFEFLFIISVFIMSVCNWFNVWMF